ncbi:MAG: AraC family transcriptional regulator [Cyanobacteria bacterium P01_F01_bin.143]
MGILSGGDSFVLTASEIKSLEDQAVQEGEVIYQTTEFGAQVNLPRKLGNAGDRIFQLRGGLTISIRSGQLWEPLVFKQQHQEIFPVIAKFYLSGNSRVKTPKVPGIEPDYEELSGYNYLYYLPDLTEFEAWQADSLIQVVMIEANLDYFRSLSTSDRILPHPLNKLIHNSQRFHQCIGKIDSTMKQVLQQIIYCPYQGVTQQLYLESKVLELLALQFASLGADSTTSRTITLKADDLERVRYARDILVQRLNNPPSLVDLSRLVQLNDRKLKQGFRQLYDTTVFGYLRDYRMDQAQHFLERSSMNIAQVANKVGYGSPEAFSTAFRRKFGVSPKAYQLGNRVS